MKATRVLTVFSVLFAVLAAVSLSTGTAQAATGACESLAGGVIEMESFANPTPTGYASLGAAFTDINSGVYAGAITIDVCGDTTEGVTAVLNASGSGSASYTGITISPAGGAARTISGGIAGVLLDLNGAANVVIDGLNTGGDALTIDNASTGATAATIRFIADASSDTVRNCTIKGASTGATSGTIVFSTGTTGNVNDTITANAITSSGANLPTNAIYSAGTPTAVNSGIAITSNNIQDYFNANAASNGILVASNSASWTITGNKLFQTAIRTVTTASTHRAINIVTASGGGYTVSNNTVGYATSAGAGTTTYAGTVVSLYRAIEMTVAASPASDIQGNTVTAISFATSSNSAVAPGVFAGISVLGGSVNIGTTSGNTIGSGSATGAILVTSTATGSLTDGIYSAAASATFNVQNNIVGGITASSVTPGTGFLVRGIETGGSGANVTLNGNTIGSTTTPNSIQVGIGGTTTAVTTFAGILNAASGTITITNNTVQNASVNGSGASIFQGISNGAGTGTLTITGNSVIAGTNRGTATSQGIVTTAPAATANITNNTVRKMTLMATAGAFRGIEQGGGVTLAINLDNNRIGDATDGFLSYTAASTGALIGVYNNAAGANAALSMQGNDVRGISYAVTGGNDISCIFAQGGTPKSQIISGNTITNLDVNTTGSVYLIRNLESLSASASGIAQNVTFNSIVGTLNKNGASGTVHGFFNNASSPTAVTLNQSDNTFSNVTVAGGSSAFCVNSQDLAKRTIERNLCNNWSGGAGSSLTGIRLAGFLTNNVLTSVASNTLTNYSSGGGLTGIQVESSNVTSTVTSNTINSFSTSNGSIAGIFAATPFNSTDTSHPTLTSNTISGLSTSGGGSPSGILIGNSTGFNQGTLNTDASLNVVSGISSTFAGATPTGITIATQATTTNVFRNKIYDIQLTAAAATGNVCGLSAGGRTNVLSNNLVGKLTALHASNTTSPSVVGCRADGTGSNVYIYDNTIYIEGTSDAAPFSTAAVFAAPGFGGTTGPVLTLRNNILANASTPTGAGRAVALWRAYDPLSTYDSASNNNDIFAPTAYYNGVSAYPTLSDMWTAVYPRESASFSANPPFVSTVGSDPTFLHIVPASTTLLESHAVNIAGITRDFDDDIRQGNGGYGGTGSAPDVGADEFEGTAVVGDVTPPAILYSLLGNDAPYTSRTLTATITDATGVATTSGVRPRVYFKKSNDLNDLTGWKYTEAIGSGDSPFDFTIDYTLLNDGSVVVGDTIQYFVVAQDTAATPNVGMYQGAFAAAPSSVALTAPAFPIGPTINSYLIVPTVSGALSVCPSSCDFDSLTNPGGLFQALNGRVFIGNVTVDILGDSTAETGTHALNQWPENPSSNFTLTIRPGGGAARIVSGSFAGGLIRLNGADRVTFDGLNTGGNSLTISNTSATNPSAVIHLVPTGTLDAGATNNTIRNLNIVGGANTAGNYGISLSGSTVGTPGPDNDGNTISGNTITRVSHAIHSNGVASPASAGNDNLVISNNTIGPATSLPADNIGFAAVFVQNANNLSVSGNTIRNVSVSAGNGGAIRVEAEVLGGAIANNTITNVISSVNVTGQNSITGIYLGSHVTNLTVSGNKIQSVSNTNLTASGSGARGIIVNTDEVSAGVTTLTNNMIADIFSFAGAANSTWPMGIDVEKTTNPVRIYHNSVSLYDSHAGANAASGSVALFIGGLATGAADVRDNVLANGYDNQNSTTDKTYAVHAQNFPAASFTDINYNDYYVHGPNNNFIGNLSGDKATIALWRTATGKDLQSIPDNPKFVSNTDLHIDTSGAATPIENTGTPIATVTNDVDSDLRNPTNPDMGADEVRCHAVIAAESCIDSNACTVDSCNPATGCSFVAGNLGATCRAAAGSCDVVETCDGTNAACPADALAPALALCRAAAGDCDAAEVCTGSSAACPADALQPSTYECRAAAGTCDVAESCTGDSAACPVDTFEPNTLECRAAAGACDVAESCTGSGAACPADTFVPSTVGCRASAGDCDVAESCTGSDAACPADAFEPSTVECRASVGDCDVAESCTGDSAACPTDVFASSTTICTGVSQGEPCDDDAADHCSGTGDSCVDAFQADTVSCTGTLNGGECDGDDHCAGTSNACLDAFLPPTQECRASTVMCDPAEFCTGKGSACPADAINQSDPVGPTVRVSYNKPTHTSTISWTEAIPGPFNVYRGSLTGGSAFAYNQSCFDYAVPGASSTDMLTPRSGRLFFYLVSRTEAPCPESNVGQDSVGADRPNPLVCPLPPPDVDGDGFQDNLDNCPANYNPSQNDVDGDTRGDVCDNCVSTPNTDQSNIDADAQGDACDPDRDGDGVPNAVDNCPNVSNPDQLDTDANGIGDACQ